MPKFRVVYKHSDDAEIIAGNAYIIEAKTERAAKIECRKLLKQRFGVNGPMTSDLNRQLVPKVICATEIDGGAQ